MAGVGRLLRCCVAVVATAGGTVAAAPPATAPAPVAVSFGEPGVAIAEDFVGLSFETKRVLADPTPPGTAGASSSILVPPRLFSADDAALVAMVRTLGIRSIRVGGNTADRATVPLPTHADVDALFAFAKAADVKVIYTLRMRDTDPAAMAAVAKYVWDRHAANLACFEIGNEPDAYFKTYADYRPRLEAFVQAVGAAAPGAALCSPSTTQGHPDWAARVAEDFANGRGGLSLVTQHVYPMGDGKKATDPAAGIDAMLSPKAAAVYDKLYATCAVPAARAGVRLRLEETNNFYLGGAAHASDTFASALWALDYAHWWAAHGAAGLNFHTSDFYPLTSDAKATWYVAFSATPDRRGYAAKPLAYALAAFHAAAPARSLPLTLDNPAGVNVSAYATLTASGELRLTVINKSRGDTARAVDITLPAGCSATHTLAMTASAVDAKNDVTLGGAAIARDGAWPGAFRPYVAGEAFVVPPASAWVARIDRPAR